MGPGRRRLRRVAAAFAAFYAVAAAGMAWGFVTPKTTSVSDSGWTTSYGGPPPTMMVVLFAVLVVGTAAMFRTRDRMLADTDRLEGALPSGPGNAPESWGLDPATAEADLRFLGLRATAMAYACAATGSVPQSAAMLFTPGMLSVLEAGTESLSTPVFRGIVGKALGMAGGTVEGVSVQVGRGILSGSGTVDLTGDGKGAGAIGTLAYAVGSAGGNSSVSDTPKRMDLSGVSPSARGYDAATGELLYGVDWQLSPEAGWVPRNVTRGDSLSLAGDGDAWDGENYAMWRIAMTAAGPRVSGSYSAKDIFHVLDNMLEVGKATVGQQ